MNGANQEQEYLNRLESIAWDKKIADQVVGRTTKNRQKRYLASVAVFFLMIGLSFTARETWITFQDEPSPYDYINPYSTNTVSVEWVTLLSNESQ